TRVGVARLPQSRACTVRDAQRGSPILRSTKAGRLEVSLSSTVVEIAAQSAVAMHLRQGDTLRIVDVHGEQVADLALFAAADLRDCFSPGRSIDYNESIRVLRGDTLYSHNSVELARVVGDVVGVHDLLLAPCSEAMFERRGELAHPSCHANLVAVLQEFGIESDAVTATLNVFMDVRVGADGKITIHPPPSRPGDAFAILALQDLVVGVSACASEKTNNGTCKPLRAELLRA